MPRYLGGASSHALVLVHPLPTPPPPLGEGNPTSLPCSPLAGPSPPTLSLCFPRPPLPDRGSTGRVGAQCGALNHRMGFEVLWHHPCAKGCAPAEQHRGTTHAGREWPVAHVPSWWDRWLLHLPVSVCAGDALVAKPVLLLEQHRWDAGAGGDIGVFPVGLAGRCHSLGLWLCPPGVLPLPHPKHQWHHGCLVLPASSGAHREVCFAPLPLALRWPHDGDSSEEGTWLTPKLPKTVSEWGCPLPCAGAAAPNLLLQGAAGSGDGGTPLGLAAGGVFHPPSGISAGIPSPGAILQRARAAPGAPVFLSQNLSHGGQKTPPK